MQPSNNEDNDGDGDGEGDNMAGHVEGVGGVAGSPSPDGTTSKAAAALAAAAEAAKVCRMSDNHVKGASIFDVHNILEFFETNHPLRPQNPYCLSVHLWYFLFPSPFCSDVLYGSHLVIFNTVMFLKL